MSLSLFYALLAVAFVLIVFLVVYRRRGMGFALAVGGLALLSMFALFAALAMFITSRM
jgi:hypothetical protein